MYSPDIMLESASLLWSARLVLPAEEVLSTLKINKRSDGMFIIEDVLEGSSAAEVITGVCKDCLKTYSSQLSKSAAAQRCSSGQLL